MKSHMVYMFMFLLHLLTKFIANWLITYRYSVILTLSLLNRAHHYQYSWTRRENTTLTLPLTVMQFRTIKLHYFLERVNNYHILFIFIWYYNDFLKYFNHAQRYLRLHMIVRHCKQSASYNITVLYILIIEHCDHYTYEYMVLTNSFCMIT